jgi:hypothetical protein
VITVKIPTRLSRWVCVLILSSSAVACGGSGGGSTPASTTSGATSIIFQQPLEAGITSHLFVPNASNASAPTGVFELVYWQMNPGSPNGLLVPTSWDASAKTGFSPSTLTGTELGTENVPGATTAQMDEGTVGVYLNSAALPGSADGQKMMITPRIAFAAGTAPVPFASSTTVLNGSMDLQIPTASGSDTYCNVVFEFQDTAGVRISYGVDIFRNGWTDMQMSTGYDAPTNSYQLNSPLGVEQQYVTMAAGSAGATGSAWVGWRSFQWSISEAQFAAALQYLSTTFPTAVQDTDPTQYSLVEMHLNAEFHFNPEPATLGWSMTKWTVWLSDSGG